MNQGFELKQTCELLKASLLLSLSHPIPQDFLFKSIHRTDQAVSPDTLLICIEHGYLKTDALINTQAVAIVCTSPLVNAIQALNPRLNLLVVDDGRSALYRLIKAFAQLQKKSYPALFHPTALILGQAFIHPTAYIGPYCVIEAGARIEAFTVLQAFVFIGTHAQIAEHVMIEAHAYIGAYTEIGARTTIGANAVIGTNGFGLDDQGQRLPHLGKVEIGEDCYLSGLTAVDKGTLGSTRIGSLVQIDHLVQIAHNVELQDQVVLCAQVGIAGGASVGKGSVLGGQVGVNNRVDIGANAKIAAKSGVTKSLKGNQSYAGYPAEENQSYLKRMALIRSFFKRNS